MGPGLHVSITDVGGFSVQRKLNRLSRVDTRRVLDAVGAVVESQTRRRIEKEKTDPETGQKWDELSPDYEQWKERHSTGGILQLHNHLRDSIQFQVRRGRVIVGSNLIYSWTHQKGDNRQHPTWERGSSRAGSKTASGTHTVEIPARPFLGLSDANRDELEEVIFDWFRRELR